MDILNHPQARIADTKLDRIKKMVEQGERISNEDALYLYEQAPLSYLGLLAHSIRLRKHDKRTYFNRNFHLEPTNVCIYDCAFCSYSRKIRKREDGWEYSLEEMVEMVKKYDGQPVTEVHIVGGRTSSVRP
jgi:aminodeoxyfutalosine synthase